MHVQASYGWKWQYEGGETVSGTRQKTEHNTTYASYLLGLIDEECNLIDAWHFKYVDVLHTMNVSILSTVWS